MPKDSGLSFYYISLEVGLFRSRPLRPEDFVICLMLGIRCKVRRKDRPEIVKRGRREAHEGKFSEKPMRKGRVVIRMTETV